MEVAASRRIDRRRQLTLQSNDARACSQDRSRARPTAAPAYTGCRGLPSTSSTVPCSTMRPEVHDRHLVREKLDHRDVVGDEEIGQAQPLLQILQQVQDLRLHRHVERAGRLVADRSASARPPARARSRCAGAGRRKTRADSGISSSGSRPTCFSSSSTRAAGAVRRCRATPSAAMPSSTISITRMRGLSELYGSWNMIWKSLRSGRSSPRRAASPDRRRRTARCRRSAAPAAGCLCPPSSCRSRTRRPARGCDASEYRATRRPPPSRDRRRA